MKILVVDQTCQLRHDRVFYRELARHAGTTLNLVTPKAWRREWGVVSVDIRDEPEIRVIPATPLFRWRQHRVMYPALPGLLRTLSPDVLFVNAEPEDWLSWQAARAVSKHSPRTKLLFMSWRNIEFVGGNIPYRLPWLHMIAERRVLSSEGHCVTHSLEASRIFAGMGFYRVTYIPPAIDTALFSPSGEMRTKETGPLQIAFVGRFHRLKGGEVLLRALQNLDGAHLTMIGRGPEEHAWKHLASDLGVSSAITWIPPIPHHELPAFLRQMDVLVLSSLTGTTWKEQFGRVLAEAMACEVAVVGSSSGEIPRVIGEGGLIVPEGDPESLRMALERFRDSPGFREECGRRGRERVNRFYSVEVTAHRFYGLLISLVR
jgi:glycosyltransferase involved in cell wall biosynthesis